jgi:hypothetical protein
VKFMGSPHDRGCQPHECSDKALRSHPPSWTRPLPQMGRHAVLHRRGHIWGTFVSETRSQSAFSFPYFPLYLYDSMIDATLSRQRSRVRTTPSDTAVHPPADTREGKLRCYYGFERHPEEIDSPISCVVRLIPSIACAYQFDSP